MLRRERSASPSARFTAENATSTFKRSQYSYFRVQPSSPRRCLSLTAIGRANVPPLSVLEAFLRILMPASMFCERRKSKFSPESYAPSASTRLIRTSTLRLTHQRYQESAFMCSIVRDHHRDDGHRRHVHGNVHFDEASRQIPLISKPFASLRDRQSGRIDRQRGAVMPRRRCLLDLVLDQTMPGRRIVRHVERERLAQRSQQALRLPEREMPDVTEQTNEANQRTRKRYGRPFFPEFISLSSSFHEPSQESRRRPRRDERTARSIFPNLF